MSRLLIEDSAVWREAILIYFDNAYALGQSLDSVLNEVKDIVATTELGRMDHTIDAIMVEWKEDRGIA